MSEPEVETAGQAATDPAGATLHHAHLMASDVDLTIDFWIACFGARVVADEAMAGTRNVLLQVGTGRLNLYAKPPNQRGPVNHLGVRVDDLSDAVARLDRAGWKPRPIKSDGPLSYSMVEGPDQLLIEVFTFDPVTTPDHLRPYFDLHDRRSPAPSDGDHGGIGPAGTGVGPLSTQARARLARPPATPLRPPPIDDLDAVARWRDDIHRSWLDGDPSPAQCGYAPRTIGGVRCLVSGQIDGTDRPLTPAVIYFHGGGYSLGSPEVALPITDRLGPGRPVISVDYRLAPEHRFPAPIEDGQAVLDAVTETAPRRPVVLAGDSAGANIAVAVAATNPGLTAGLVLLSPHLEFDDDPPPQAGGPPSANQAQAADPLSDVDATTARWLRSAYLGGSSMVGEAVDPLAAPAVHGTESLLANLPPILLQVGSLEHGLASAWRFARRARLTGVDVTLDVWDGLWHTWHYHRDLPEADRALAEAARFVDRLGW